MQKVLKLIPSSPHASKLAHESGISILQAQLLINRGISDISSVKSFLSPRLSNLIDPMLLKDMDMAVEMILNTIDVHENILIYGDFDADGLTATALLLNFFTGMDIHVSFYVPDRLKEGYSLNPDAVKKIAQDGVKLIITVDCGTANMKEIALARQLGMKVVVTDHHQVPEDFKPICPVVNPYRPDSSFPFKNLAGVGMAFFLTIAIRAELRRRGWFSNRPEPDLKDYLDLVALGTVADIVPLVDQNRILVKAGIERMKISRWPGIKSIRETAGISASGVTSDDLAYRLAPRLNASGRMGDSKTGIDILTTDKLSIARDLARQLNTLNIQRQAIEQNILEQIEKDLISMKDLEHRRSLVFSGDGWHRGVLGIVASKLVDKYRRPVLVLDIQDGMAVGSGRSIKGFNLYKALARLEHLLERFGGHYHAAGLSLKASNVEALTMELESLARHELSEEDLIPAIKIDAEIMLPDLTMETVNQIRSLSPFGSGNPEPLFYAHSLKVIESRVVGERHLKLKVKQGRTIREAIGFGLSERHPLEGKTISMVFTPEIDRWNGKEKIQLRIIDLKVVTANGKPLNISTVEL